MEFFSLYSYGLCVWGWGVWSFQSFCYSAESWGLKLCFREGDNETKMNVIFYSCMYIGTIVVLFTCWIMLCTYRCSSLLLLNIDLDLLLLIKWMCTQQCIHMDMVVNGYVNTRLNFAVTILSTYPTEIHNLHHKVVPAKCYCCFLTCWFSVWYVQDACFMKIYICKPMRNGPYKYFVSFNEVHSSTV